MAVLPPDAGLLVAAERHFDRGDVVVVDPAGAGLQPGDDPVGAGDVGREDAGGEAELGRVGAFDRLFLVAEGQEDRKSVVSGKSVSVRVDLGGRGIIKTKKKQ